MLKLKTIDFIHLITELVISREKHFIHMENLNKSIVLVYQWASSTNLLKTTSYF